MITEGCKSVTDHFWFSSITSLLTHLHHSNPTVPCASYRKYLYLCYTCKDNALLHTHHLQPFTLGTVSGYLLWKVSAPVSWNHQKHMTKSHTFHMIFPWETADEYLHQGKGGKIQTIVRFSVQTLIILNLVSWNGLHRSNVFKMIVCWEYTVRGSSYICVRNHYVSGSCEFHAALTRRYTSRSPIHILLNSYPHMLPIIMYIFSKWISSNMI